MNHHLRLRPLLFAAVGDLNVPTAFAKNGDAAPLYPLRHISFQHLVAVFCSLNKMVVNLKDRMTTAPVHHLTSFFANTIPAKAGGFNPMMDNKQKS